jgi:sugar lactone lactonase YvrE
VPLESGHNLLQYRLVEQIGEGGMGVVWRALDTSLDREVAIKILPEAVAANAERLARFEREAKAVAALTHPNVLSVFDYGREGSTTYMVTELLDGDSLRARLVEGPLPPRKAAELARQAARGLAAAHAKGLVHRDLKPENIFITRDGRVKILDFGLATSRTVPRGTEADAAHTPTATELTSPGTVLGTVDYMSPEQVRGEPADHRSDIFSLGTCLHEMLTATRPFRRDTPAETMTAVLREDPSEPGGDSRVEIPPALDRVVRRCLEKQPDERFQSASDLAFAVDNALGTSGSTITGRLPAITGRLPAITEPARGARRRWWMPVAAVALIVAGGFGGRLTGPEPSSQPFFKQLTFRQGRMSSARFAADGGAVVYAAGWDGGGLGLYTVQQGSPESRPLEIDDADVLSISAQGEMALLLDPTYIVGWSVRGTLARVPIHGGAPREMLSNIASADWDPSGEQVAVARVEGGVWLLEYPPGNVLYRGEGWIGDVRFSPDGRRIAFADHPRIGDDHGYAAVSDLEGNVRRLGPAWRSLQGVAWPPDGEEIWFTAVETGTVRAVRAVDLDGNVRVVTRAPADLKLLDIDATGRALISRDTATRRIVGRAPGAAEEISLSWFDWTFPESISADGETVVFTEQGEGGGQGYSTYMRPTRGGPAVRLGAGQAYDMDADGSRVICGEFSGPRMFIYPTGAGEARSFEVPGFRHGDAFWTGRGDELILVGHLNDAPLQAFLHDPAAGRLDPVTPENIDWGTLFYHRTLGLLTTRVNDGPMQIFSIHGDEPRTLSGIEPSWAVVGWSEDGQLLYLADLGKVPLPVLRYDVRTAEVEPFVELMPSDVAGLIDIGPVAFTPSGDAYLYSYRQRLSTLYMAEDF